MVAYNIVGYINGIRENIRQIKFRIRVTWSVWFSISFKIYLNVLSRTMSSISLLVLLVIVATLNLTEGGGDGEHHHIIIHVPYHVKKIKHTHTITKHIHHGGGDKYEVLGYTVGQPINIGGHDGFGGHENHGGHGEFNLHGGYGGQENQEIHYGGHHGGHNFEQVGNEINQEGYNLGGHEEFTSYGGGGGGGGGHEEQQVSGY
ncbi:uncharacterized protein LOC127288507 [Leptopilina boulardi]|uniref:uncharacterized protein LOC127288507 n=1 Tax=Leptopilina boulardi TaxID=63433 RepID=UPI0021F6566E|nr:uncharacterized protein LOC127288507 [Leptopilina boulardi]